MHFCNIGAICLGLAPLVLSQGGTLQDSLSAALTNYPGFSTFKGLLASNASLLGAILPSSVGKVTMLIPDNDAFSKFAAQKGQLSSIPADQLVSILKYHVMVSELTSSNFTVAGGITIPTLLEDQQYNNRTPSADLTAQFGANAIGQVIYASADPINPAKIKVRDGAATSVELRGGLAQGADLNAVDGTWAGGVFQGVNTVMTPPTKCSATTRTLESTLASFDNALNRTKFWSRIDVTPNVTCLAPQNSAWTAAGNPDQVLSTGDLTNTILFHTLAVPTYSNLLKDGQEFNSMANVTVRVSIKGGAIYFNDAKLVSPNVLTNNGLIHILDRVMTPLNGSSTSTPTSTASSSPSSTKNSGAARMGSHSWAGFIAAMFTAGLLI